MGDFSKVPRVQTEVFAISPGPAGLSEGRGFIDRALAAAGFDAAARYQITVATNEAVSNAMEHGAPCDDGRFHLSASVEQGSFVFHVRDCGKFEDAASLLPDPVAERGRGFAFMNLLMDDVHLDARAGRTVLRLAKRLPGTPPPARGTSRLPSRATAAWSRTSSAHSPCATWRAPRSWSTAG
jgi:anti-sigma regulatory factor (Ser/Thr protein kinase)